MQPGKRMAIAVVAAFAATLANAELVRCTSKNGASVIRRDKCDSPDDVRTPVTATPGTRKESMPAQPAASAATDDAMAAYRAQDFARARVLFEERAAKGDALAQLMLGDIYKNGRGVPKDEAKAYSWTRKAAEQGDARGQAALAALMQAGSGTPRDDAGAIAWLEKSAQQGYVLAQAALGSAYLSGQGVKKDEEKAVQWLRKAAAQGDDYANRTLRKMGRASG